MGFGPLCTDGASCPVGAAAWRGMIKLNQTEAKHFQVIVKRITTLLFKDNIAQLFSEHLQGTNVEHLGAFQQICLCCLHEVDHCYKYPFPVSHMSVGVLSITSIKIKVIGFLPRLIGMSCPRRPNSHACPGTWTPFMLCSVSLCYSILSSLDPQLVR